MNTNETTTVDSGVDATPSVHRVSVRAAPFWPERPALWFAQLEAQFGLAGVTVDATKFYYVTSQLDSRYASEVEDIIINPPAHDKYTAIKTELITRLSTSQTSRIKQLLEREEIGDRTPSQFLRHLRSLGDKTVPDDLLRTLWLGRLPLRMQDILAASHTNDLSALALLADKIDENSSGPRVASVVSATSVAQDSRWDDFAKQLATLSASVAALTTRQTFGSRQRSRSRPRSMGVSNSTFQDSSDGVCWFHRQYGDRARSCRPPCSFTNKAGNAEGSRS